MDDEQEIWDVLHRHLDSIFAGDSKTYVETTADDLSLYEWWVTPHRQLHLPAQHGHRVRRQAPDAQRIPRARQAGRRVEGRPC